MTPNWLILDIATAAVPDVEQYLTPAAERTTPSNYTKPESIAAWQQADFEKDRSRAALDWDLARITGIGWAGGLHVGSQSVSIRDQDTEQEALLMVAALIKTGDRLISYNGRAFDWPLLMRRARYLGVEFPAINCDRFKSPHLDLMDLLTLHDPSKRKALGWYVRRLGWTDLVKPLSGEEEARVPETGRWDDLAASLAHDVEATRRLAAWLGVL